MNNDFISKINALQEYNPHIAGELGNVKNALLQGDFEQAENYYRQARKKQPGLDEDLIFNFQEDYLNNEDIQQRLGVKEEEIKKIKKDSPYHPKSHPPSIETLRFENMLRHESIMKLTEQDPEKMKAYMATQKEVYEKWSKDKKNRKLSEEDKEAFKRSSAFRNLIDVNFQKKYEEELKKEIKNRRNGIYTDVNKDKAVVELRKILNEIDNDDRYEKQNKKRFGRKLTEEEIRKNKEARKRQAKLSFARSFNKKAKVYCATLEELNGLKFNKKDAPYFEEDQKSWLQERLKKQLYYFFRKKIKKQQTEPLQPIARRQFSSGMVNRINKVFSSDGFGMSLPNPFRGHMTGFGGGQGGLVSSGGKQLLTAGGRAAVSNPYVLIAIIAIVVIILLIVIIGGYEDIKSKETGTLTLTKSVDKPQIPNPSGSSADEVTFTINANYKGSFEQIKISDPIPENAIFVSATGNYILIKDSANNVQKAEWTIFPTSKASSSAILNSTDSSFDASKFTKYGFPNPTTPTVMSEAVKKRWQTYMMPHAVKAAQVLDIDIGWIGMWAWIEDSFNTYMDNCRDDGIFNPNRYCSGWNGNWQVGYGNHPGYMINNLKTAINVMHQGKSVKEIGDNVIDESKNKDKYSGKFIPITFISTFPDLSVDQIISGAKSGNSQMRMLLGVLMKDDAIGAYLIGQHFKDLTMVNGSRLASVMNGWTKGGYYAPQKVINMIAGVYAAGITSTSFNGEVNETVKITLKPKPTAKDTYIVNVVSGEVIGGTTSSEPEINTSSNQESCGGKYSSITTIAIGNNFNFGDPACDYANSPTTSFTFTKGSYKGSTVSIKTVLYEKLNQLDHSSLEYWVGIIKCESDFNPNSYYVPKSSEKCGGKTCPPVYGLYQLDGPTDSVDGKYDIGIVDWKKQTENAINYNKNVLHGNWKYWACAKTVFGLW